MNVTRYRAGSVATPSKGSPATTAASSRPVRTTTGTANPNSSSIAPARSAATSASGSALSSSTLPLRRWVRTSAYPRRSSSSFRRGMPTWRARPRLMPRSNATYRTASAMARTLAPSGGAPGLPPRPAEGPPAAPHRSHARGGTLQRGRWRSLRCSRGCRQAKTGSQAPASTPATSAAAQTRAAARTKAVSRRRQHRAAGVGAGPAGGESAGVHRQGQPSTAAHGAHEQRERRPGEEPQRGERVAPGSPPRGPGGPAGWSATRRPAAAPGAVRRARRRRSGSETRQWTVSASASRTGSVDATRSTPGRARASTRSGQPRRRSSQPSPSSPKSTFTHATPAAPRSSGQVRASTARGVVSPAAGSRHSSAASSTDGVTQVAADQQHDGTTADRGQLGDRVDRRQRHLRGPARAAGAGSCRRRGGDGPQVEDVVGERGDHGGVVGDHDHARGRRPAAPPAARPARPRCRGPGRRWARRARGPPGGWPVRSRPRAAAAGRRRG